MSTRPFESGSRKPRALDAQVAPDDAGEGLQPALQQCHLARRHPFLRAEHAVLAGPKQIAIRLVATGPDHPIRADPQRLKQALRIGIDNAIKYADPGGTVEIGIDRQDGELVLSMSTGWRSAASSGRSGARCWC